MATFSIVTCTCPLKHYWYSNSAAFAFGAFLAVVFCQNRSPPGASYVCMWAAQLNSLSLHGRLLAFTSVRVVGRQAALLWFFRCRFHGSVRAALPSSAIVYFAALGLCACTAYVCLQWFELPVWEPVDCLGFPTSQTSSHSCSMSLCLDIRHNSHSEFSLCNMKVGSQTMEDIVDLSDTSGVPSSQLPLGPNCDRKPRALDTDCTQPTGIPGESRHGRGGGRARGTRSLSGPTPSHNSLPHKLRGPKSEMLVLIGQKRVKWDGRHNCSQPSLAKFVYGTTAWRSVLSGCMAAPGFRVRDADQLTNKWDGLIKDYKKLKDYIKGTGSANWWGMSREEKRDLCKTRKLPLEFSECMYKEMENFVGKRQIFGRATDVVDSDRLASPPLKQFGRSPPSPRAPAFAGGSSPTTSSTTAPAPPTAVTPGDHTPGSTGRKRKAVGTDNLVDFVKDFNHEYLVRVEAQEKDKQSWRSDVMALDTAREVRIAHKEAQAFSMDNKLYELEVERTRNLGNMTSVLLMLASSMDTLTRFSLQPTTLPSMSLFNVTLSADVWQCIRSFEHEPSSPIDPPVPSSPPTKLCLRSRVLKVSEDGRCPLPFSVGGCHRPWVAGDTPLVFGPMCGLYLQVKCCATIYLLKYLSSFSVIKNVNVGSFVQI